MSDMNNSVTGMADFRKRAVTFFRCSVFTLTVLFLILSDNTVLAGNPIEVQVGLKIQQVTGINQKEENFGVVGTLIMKYHEPALALEEGEGGSDQPPRMYEANNFVRLMTERNLLWPASSFYNAQGKIAYQNRIVVVDPEGNVSYLARFAATFQAPDFDFRHFPLDQQDFSIKLDLLPPVDMIVFTPLPDYSGIGDTLGEEEWRIGNAGVQMTTYNEMGFASSRFMFSFHGKRHINYYVVRIFIPVVIIILVSWFSFFLKDYSKRIDLASGNLLMFIAFNFIIANDLPRLGYLTLMDTFLLATFAITGLVVLVNVSLRRLQSHEKNAFVKTIDSICLWGYPFTYFAAGMLMVWLFYK